MCNRKKVKYRTYISRICKKSWRPCATASTRVGSRQTASHLFRPRTPTVTKRDFVAPTSTASTSGSSAFRDRSYGEALPFGVPVLIPQFPGLTRTQLAPFYPARVISRPIKSALAKSTLFQSRQWAEFIANSSPCLRTNRCRKDRGSL